MRHKAEPTLRSIFKPGADLIMKVICTNENKKAARAYHDLLEAAKEDWDRIPILGKGSYAEVRNQGHCFNREGHLHRSNTQEGNRPI